MITDTTTIVPVEGSSDSSSEVYSDQNETTTAALAKCKNYGCNPGWYQVGEHTDDKRQCIQTWCCPINNCADNQDLISSWYNAVEINCYYECQCKAGLWNVSFTDGRPDMCVGESCVYITFGGININLNYFL